MAAATAWSKVGSWAIDSEAAEQEGNRFGSSTSDPNPAAAAADFPSLADAKTKLPRKKKNQPLSLAEFTTGQPVTHGAAKYVPSRGITVDEPLSLPTGPRERSAEELERSGRGFGYSYGLGRGGAARDEPRRAREPNPDLGPSRADEVDDWGAAKRSAPAPFPERRERGGMFSDNASRADESDTWVKKSAPLPPAEGRRTGGGFDAPRRGGGFDTLSREGMDSESWMKKREDSTSPVAAAAAGGGGRPRLVLQPRTLPLATGDGTSNGHAHHNAEEPESQPPMIHVQQKSKSNPFGAARPREEVLAEKGQDWKKIDEKLDSMKVSEAPPEFGRRGFSSRNLGTEDRTERAWRKQDSSDDSVSSSGAELSEGGSVDN